MYRQSDVGHGADGAGRSLPRVAAVSRSSVRAAMAILGQQHGVADADDAFAALQTASQRHNVKLRSVAAAVVARPATTDGKSIAAQHLSPPKLSFTARGAAAQPNRTNVVGDLMRAAVAVTAADFGTVQLRDPVQGGFILEGHKGFDSEFLHFFSYIDVAGSACGTSLTQGQVLIVDVATSPLFTEPERRAVLVAGVRAMLLTPMLDAGGSVGGLVATHYAHSRDLPDDAAMRTVRRQADECARWLCWYDAVVMPGVVATAHAAAAQVARRDVVADV